MNELALFAGAGGGLLGGKLLGWRTVCAVEREPYAASVLMQRQNDGLLAPFPIWDDVCTFDGKPWKGVVDVVSGGFPCQDISIAGTQKGINGEKSSMWFQMLRIIKEINPKYVFIENSPNIRTKGLDVVAKGLTEAGYDVAWTVLSAKQLGAQHERKRMWIVASNSNCINDALRGYSTGCTEELLCGHYDIRGSVFNSGERYSEEAGSTERNSDRERDIHWWENSPKLCRMDDGLAFGMDRLKALGNGQVPIVAAVAFCKLINSIE